MLEIQLRGSKIIRVRSNVVKEDKQEVELKECEVFD